jgi:putative addiction module component (TIGR02574 family)
VIPLLEKTQRWDRLAEINTVDQNVDAVWQQEVSRCLDEVKSGKVKTVPLEEVQKKGHKLLHGK